MPDKAVEICEAGLADQPDCLEALFQLGGLRYRQGRTGEALQHFTAAVNLNPDNAIAWSILAVICMELARPEDALAHCDRALALKPDYPETLHTRGEALTMLTRPAEALPCYDKALALRPGYAAALNSRALALRDLGHHEEALANLNEAITLAPADAVSHYNLAISLNDLGRHAEALVSCDKALALEPDYPEALHTRGDALRMLMRPAEALPCYDKALALRPGYAATLNNRALALRDLGRHEEALANLNEAITLAPANAVSHNSLAMLLNDLGRHAEALLCCDRALALQPGYVEALNSRAFALFALGDFNRAEEGLASIARALSVNPGYAEARANVGIWLSELGRFEEANRAIRQAIALDPRRAAYYYTLTETCRLTADDPLIDAMQELALDVGSLDAKEQVFLLFALANALAGSDPERSFQHLLAANARQRKLVAYDEAAALSLLERTRLLFTADLMRSKAGLGDPSRTPVFVLGMPRSGTTLAEQILASHPGVSCLGEADTFNKAILELCGQDADRLHFPAGIPPLSAEFLHQTGAACAAQMKALAPAADRIVDKTLDNTRFAGFIHLALPNARIVHMRRDPLDTCFSCFSKFFADGSLCFTYDLGELGRYYRAYEALMTNWREVLPEGVMLEVQYEELVADLEGQARRIVAHCGLEWDATCLEFHKTGRRVRTVSKIQVRQPLYKSSVGRGHLFEAQLAPLLEALRG